MAESTWVHGVHRRGRTLVVRDRWQGLFGPNAWLTITLAFVAVVFGREATLRRVCDPSDTTTATLGDSTFDLPTCDSFVVRFRGWDDLALGQLGVALGAVAGLVVVAVAFFPFVVFGPSDVRWRNAFRTRTVAVADLDRLVVESRNWRAWVPAVTAVRNDAFERRASFIATFSHRRRRAHIVATEVKRWADEQNIRHEIDAAIMAWRLSPPERSGIASRSHE